MENNNFKKFLDFEMSTEEETAFKKTEEYKIHQKTLELFDNSKAIPFDDKKLFTNINSNKHTSNKVIPIYKKWLPISIAASILLCFSLFYFYSVKPVTYNTIVGESIQFSLPDESSVWLNAKSEISHNNDWDNARDIKLNGEAYFEVAKGKKFTVETPHGLVTVLGTKFNVKQRGILFEVHCYEGSVAVEYKNTKTILKPNDIFSSKENRKHLKIRKQPDWMTNRSIFHNKNLNEVVADISLHYDIEFKPNIDLNNLPLKYTGSYNYTDDLQTVLEVLCQSLNLSYRIENKTVYLNTKE